MFNTNLRISDFQNNLGDLHHTFDIISNFLIYGCDVCYSTNLTIRL